MKKEEFQTTNPRELARLIELEDVQHAWAPEEWAEVFQHQLQTPLSADLASEGPPLDERLAACREAGECPLVTFGDLIRSDAPPLDLLLRLKNFSKKFIKGAETGIPREIATLLYYLSILRAFLIHKKRISSLDSASLREGLEWSLRQQWIPADVRRILEDGRARL